MFQPGSAARVRFASDKKLVEATRPAESIRLFQHLEESLRAQFQRAVAVRVKFGNDQCQVVVNGNGRSEGIASRREGALANPQALGQRLSED